MRFSLSVPFSAAALAVAALAFAPHAAHAQSPAYYILNGDGSTMFVVQNGIATRVTVPSLSYGVSVRDSVLVANRDTQNATEYTLAGTPTGTTYVNGTSFTQLLDGTTDGSQFNYGAVYGDVTEIIRTDLTWGGATSLFSLQDAIESVTFDTTSGNLWVGFFDNTIRQYTTAGVLTSSFTAGDTASLAYDQTSDTLWTAPNGGSVLRQFSKSGSLLQTVTVTGQDFSSFGNNYGGEFRITAASPSAAPEPGTLALLLPVLGSVGIVIRRRKR